MAETTRRTSRSLALVVLAAGKGTRMRSATPKVLHEVCGRPVLWHVLQAGLAAKPTKVIVVVGHDADDVREAVTSWGITPKPTFVVQRPQVGTGHAVMVAQRAVGRATEVLVANGDFDPVTDDDVRALLRAHRRSRSAATLLTAELDDPGSYGRVIRDGRGRFVEIDEDLDTPGADAIREVGTNWIAFDRRALYDALPGLDTRNRQRERYLNRVYPILRDRGRKVTAVLGDTGGVMGANSRSGIAGLDALLRRRINEAHMEAGVTIVDPATTYIDADVTIGPDTVIRPMTFLEGPTEIGAGCEIGPSVRLVDTEVGDRCTISFSVAELAVLGDGVEVGPFAHLRANAQLLDGSVVGNFVEVKDSTLGPGAKAKHLTYLGNAEIGDGANVGAGTVTVNYDGYAKHRTVVGSAARIGSDTMLVAPVTVGDGAVTGAGSVITRDVPAGALAVERGEQRTVEGYRERQDATRADRARRGRSTRRGEGGR